MFVSTAADVLEPLQLHLRRGNLSTLLLKRKHHGKTVSQGKVIPGEVKAVAAFVRPDRADARPNLLTIPIFARIPAVIEDIGWCVWHRNVVNVTTFSVGDWQGASIHGRVARQSATGRKKKTPRGYAQAHREGGVLCGARGFFSC